MSIYLLFKLGKIKRCREKSQIFSQNVTKENILNKIKQFNKSLVEDFGIFKPRIAVLGLNPHAGDKGVIGKEEEEIIPEDEK